jgi:predicted ATPase
VELAELIKALFESYGAAALPWSVMAFLGWLVIRDRMKDREAVPHEYKTLVDNYHEAIVDNTNAITRLAVLLEERTRRQSRA